MKKWLVWLISICVVIAACSKGGLGTDDGGGPGAGGNGPHVINLSDTVPPVVEIQTPAANQVFTSGAIINVTGKVTDGDGLYRGSVRIVNDASGALLKEQLYEIHGTQQYNFSITHTATSTTSADYTVIVIFEDHGQNTTSRSVKVKINP